MAPKKTKFSIKVRDLTPAKDAIGGRHGHHGHQFSSLLNQKEGPGAHTPGGGYGIHMVQ